MIITNEVKKKIEEEYKDFREHLYAGKSLTERKQLDQFFTPPSLSIAMIEQFEDDDISGKNILDPTCGSGNLLVACLLAGADADKIYGNDYDPVMVATCRERIKRVCKKYNIKGFNEWQIHRGNAQQGCCLRCFGPEYDAEYDVNKINDLGYAQISLTANVGKKNTFDW